MSHNITGTDYVFILGDIFSHSYFKKSQKELIETNVYFTETIKETFPNAKIIPVLGNHECDPIDNFDFEDKNNFVVKNIYSLYRNWISQKQIDDLINNGFYEHRDEEHNVKIISMNSQVQDTFNMMIWKNSTDPLNFFKKFANTLYESEKNGEKVILLSHIPVMDDYGIEAWGKNYIAILDRFHDTLVTSFSAHTHRDEFRFFRNSKDEIVHVNFISPSITSFGSFNPSFRIYNFEDGFVKDFDQYRFDMNFYNSRAEQGIFDFAYHLAYKFSREYDVKSLKSIQDLTDFNKKFSDEKYLEKYYRNYKTNRNSDINEQTKIFMRCKMKQTLTEQYKCMYQKNAVTIRFIGILLFDDFFGIPWIKSKNNDFE